MLYTDLKAGQIVMIGDAVIKLEGIKDISHGTQAKARLSIDAPQHIKISFGANRRKPD